MVLNNTNLAARSTFLLCQSPYARLQLACVCVCVVPLRMNFDLIMTKTANQNDTGKPLLFFSCIHFSFSGLIVWTKLILTDGGDEREAVGCGWKWKFMILFVFAATMIYLWQLINLNMFWGQFSGWIEVRLQWVPHEQSLCCILVAL